MILFLTSKATDRIFSNLNNNTITNVYAIKLVIITYLLQCLSILSMFHCYIQHTKSTDIIFWKYFFRLPMLCMSCLYKAGDGHTRFFCFILYVWYGTWLLLWFVIVSTKKNLFGFVFLSLCLCYVIFMEVVYVY